MPDPVSKPVPASKPVPVPNPVHEPPKSKFPVEMNGISSNLDDYMADESQVESPITENAVSKNLCPKKNESKTSRSQEKIFPDIYDLSLSDSFANIKFSSIPEIVPVMDSTELASFRLDDLVPKRIIDPFIKSLPPRYKTVANALENLCYLQTAIQLYATTNVPVTPHVRIFSPMTKLGFSFPEPAIALLHGLGNFKAKTGMVNVRYMANTIGTAIYNATHEDKIHDAYFIKHKFGFDKLVDVSIRALKKSSSFITRNKSGQIFVTPTADLDNPLTDTQLQDYIPGWIGKKSEIISLHRLIASDFVENSPKLEALMKTVGEYLGMKPIDTDISTLLSKAAHLVCDWETKFSSEIAGRFNLAPNNVSKQGCPGQVYLRKNKEKVVLTPFPSADSDRVYGYTLYPAYAYEFKHHIHFL